MKSRFSLIIALFVGLALLQGFIFPFKLSSQTSAELLEKIKAKEAELALTISQINELEAQLEQDKIALENAAEGIPLLKAQIDEIETQLSINSKLLELAKQEHQLKEEERKRLLILQEESIESLYLRWRINRTGIGFIAGNENVLLTEVLGDRVVGASSENLNELKRLIENIDYEVREKTALTDKLAKSNSELARQKSDLENQIDYYNGLLATNTSNISNLKDVQSEIVGQISDLTLEQKAAAEKEAWILQQELSKKRLESDIDITEGFYFTGMGRDVYQGHGVGFSQFGSYGGAEAGMSYEELIKFYYTGVELGTAGGTVNVYGVADSIDVEDYLVHLGEVPDKACGSIAQVKDNPEKYALSGQGLWSCWPEEAIKAQIIVARTYALFHKNLYSTAKSQVYDERYDKSWAVQETSGIVVLYNGALIDAVYSSDNNQGFGTANNDTVFQNFYGEGIPYEYLRSVDDSSFALKTSWSSFTYSTNLYNTDSIMEMLTYLSSDKTTGYDGAIKANIANLAISLKSISALSLEKDPSNRVSKVTFEGVEGIKLSIGGWWFKNLWNTWVYETGRNDYLYSQTFSILNNF